MSDEPTTGLTPGRKIKAAMWMSLWISSSAGVLAHFKTPDDIISHVLFITGAGWIFAIGGQTLVDAVQHGMWNSKLKTETTKTETVKSEIKP